MNDKTEYIKREDAVRSLLDYLSWHKACGTQNEDFQSAIACCASRILNDDITIPAADVAPVVRGEWIGFTGSAYVGTDDCGDPVFADRKFYRCSICRKGTAVKTNGCPHCLAHMDLKEEQPNG